MKEKENNQEISTQEETNQIRRQKVVLNVFRVVLLLLVALLTVRIFAFSAETAEVSSKTSEQFVETVEEIVNDVAETVSEVVKKQPLQNRITLNRAFMRKAAHFSEYAALGLLSFVALFLFTKKAPLSLLAGVYGALISSLDETLQTFVDGRAGAFTDVLIDLSGFLVGMLVALFFVWILSKSAKKRRQKREENLKNGV